MGQIAYNSLDSYLKELQDSLKQDDSRPPVAPAPVYLIYGEELLYKTALQKLLDVLLPPRLRHVNYEPVDGSNGNVHEALEKVSTYSLLGGRKVVALLDARVFDTKQDTDRLLLNAKQAYDSKDLQKAATHLVRFMSLLNMHLDDIAGPNRSTKIPGDSELLQDSRWLDDIVDFCRQTGVSVSTDAVADSILQKTLERGIPKGNHLIITTDTIDKRKKLYNIIVDAGVAIDCSVPRGERRADKKLQVAVLSEMKKSILTKSSKTMEPGAFEALYGLTGFDLRTFSNNLEKLVTYTGDRKQITRQDIETVLHRTKQDPIFAFTNAITDKNRVEALFFMNSLLSDAQKPMRPEQVIVAVLNQIRKLLRIKEFIAGPAGHTWFGGCPYGQFNSVVMPAIQESDRALLEELQQWQDSLAGTGSSESRPKQRGKKKPAKPRTDLLIAKNPKNSYPVYQLFKKSEQFSMDELFSAFESLTRSDLRIKSGSENKKLILEELIFNICQ